MAIDLANLTADQWKEGMGEVDPGAPVTTTTTPEPAREAAEVPRGTDSAPQGDTRLRNPDGTFAPRAGDAPTQEAPVKAAPFDGFEKLDPAIQAQYNRLLGERDDFKLRYTRLNGEYRESRGNRTGPAERPSPA
jgi:hypothetical protein